MALTQITEKGIKDGEILNADINASAAIAGTKISPNFGSQDLTTTGSLGGKNLNLTHTIPSISLTDSDGDDDFQIKVDGGLFKLIDATNTADRLVIDSSGNIGLGVSNPSSFNADGRNLIVGTGSGGQGISIYSANNNYGNIYFADGTSDGSYNAGGILYNHSSNFMRFDTAAAERMRIDSSGTIQVKGDGGNNNKIYGYDGANLAWILGNNNSDDPEFTNFRSGNLLFKTDGSERMRIDSSGKVGIGVSSPTRTIDAHVTDSGANYIHLTNAGTGAGDANGTFIGLDAAEGALIWNQESTNVRFATNNTERIRIDSSGRLLLNTTSHFNDSLFAILFDGTTQNAIVAKTTRTQNTGSNFAVFLNSSGGVAGQIYHNGATTVQYITTSDYRLKENQTAISDGITRLKTLKPYRFNFIEEPEKTVDGFFAHEVGTAVPEAIKGTKDEVDKDNNPVYQGIDQSKLVPLLTAALQEEVSKREALETRVAALEAA